MRGGGRGGTRGRGGGAAGTTSPTLRGVGPTRLAAREARTALAGAALRGVGPTRLVAKRPGRCIEMKRVGPGARDVPGCSIEMLRDSC
jgi:hypothetical protein